MKAGYGRKMAARIITVDPATRRIEGHLKDGAMVQIAAQAVSTVFRWPLEGEVWIIRKDDGFWILDKRIENPEDGLGDISELNAGDTKITGNTVIAGSAKISGNTTIDGSLIVNNNSLENIITGLLPQFATQVARTTSSLSIGLSSTLAGTGNLFPTSITFTADGATTYKITLSVPRIKSPTTSDSSTNIHLTNGSNTSLGVLASMFAGSATPTYAPCYGAVYLTPSAGSVTYNVSGTSSGGGFSAGSGGSTTFVNALLEVYK